MIECLYYYPMQHKEGKQHWIIGHCAFRFTNWKLNVSDCALVKGKDGSKCFISPPQKKYMKDGRNQYMRYWNLDDDVFEEFQQQGKAAIIKLCRERNIEIPEELSEFATE